ncbi:multidrug effflux MFS transporter [Plantactinospora soyae]|uniref:DHA1 family bicyclomycin/chloramphenicol resistance-like MFS transporter n=1 Tax=Plantactinospora soyae TaxID=1544732 RepID=A0A927M217_9ACTN|nr:multidrug effflux MFS transporter [Plantactinospora soyae]MBE1486184.1 DHA1 family bicyclomycin/chloramphenicol resistance-like MFS transporter [Plantactinospora soyae]
MTSTPSRSEQSSPPIPSIPPQPLSPEPLPSQSIPAHPNPAQQLPSEPPPAEPSPPEPSPAEPSPVRPAGLPVLLTVALVLLAFVPPMGIDMYLPAFPLMAEEFRTDPSGIQLTLTAFLVGLALGQLVLGPLSDRYGRRILILTGTALCAASAAACAIAPSLESLTVLRFLMGFSGAAGVVVGRAVVSDTAKGPAAARMFGILMALGGIAPIVAPLIGGAVISAAGWRAVFGVLAAGSLLTFLITLVAVPESLPPERRHAGGLRSTLATARSLLRDRIYLGYTFAFGFGFAALFCYIAASPFFLQYVLRLTVGQASVAFAAGALVATLSSAVNAKIVGRISPVTLLRTGLAAMLTSSAALLGVTLAGQLDRIVVLGPLLLFFVGLGMMMGNATALAIQRVPHAAGTGSAVLGTLQAVLAATVAPLMGLGGRDVAEPLFLGMTVCVGLACLALRFTRRPAVAG